MKFEEYRNYDSTGLAELVAKGEVSEIELLDTCIERIEAANLDVNAVIYKQYDSARAAIEGGLPDGPLKGVPYAIKDYGNGDAGHPSSNGSNLFKDNIAPYDSTYVERVKKAGLVIVGRTNTPEFGINTSTEPVAHGATCNPWNTEFSAGGSSGGAAAAVASGMMPTAHATDGGGSIRIPAANCGLVGLKPTRGRNPIGPDLGEGWGGLSTGHVVSRSVRDTALFLDCTHGPAPGDPYAAVPPERPFADEVGRSPGKLKIAMMTTDSFGQPFDPECARAIELGAKLCQELGHDVVEAKPNVNFAEFRSVIRRVIASNVAHTVNSYCKKLGRSLAKEDLEYVSHRAVQVGMSLTGEQMAAAVHAMHRFGRIYGEFFQDYDLTLGATTSKPPVPLGYQNMNDEDIGVFEERVADSTSITSVYNWTGGAAISLPLHWTGDGLPVGTHFGGDLGSEGTLIRVAAQLEEAKPWFHKIPNI